MEYEDRQYQIDACDSVFKYLKKNPAGHPVVALPTGSGKTAVMNRIVKRIFDENRDANVLVVSHDSRILEQNAEGLSSICGVSINSASLGSRDFGKLTVAGVQSIYRDAILSMFDWVIIDEAHTIPQSEDSMYRRMLDHVGRHTRIGLTATPYRTGQGYIVGPDHMFDKIVIDITFGAKFTKLVKDGYLSNLTINNTQIHLETEGIHTQAGDFSLKEMSEKFNRLSITRAALREMFEKGKDRKKWLVFAIDIDHAEAISDELRTMGIMAMPVHSRNEFDNDSMIRRFRSGTLKCIVNVGMLTTGFDAPDIDMIGLLRPTQSAGLHVQMIGRGLRVAPGKEDCLVLDYAGNTERLGPINRITPWTKGEAKGTGAPITKTCEVCDTIVAPNVKVCPKCGIEFKFKNLIDVASGSTEIIADSAAKYYRVDSIRFNLHKKAGGVPSIKVTYQCGLRSFNEWVCANHKGYAGSKAKHWLSKVGVEHKGVLLETIELLRRAKVPKRIQVNTDSKYPEVINREF